MNQIQVAKAERRSGAVEIVQKMIGEVPDDLGFDTSLGEIEAYARYVNCDVALELRGGRLWLWSVKVRA